MAEKTYIGVSNVAKEVAKAYIGVDGIAKEIRKIYAGVDGVAELIYSAPLPFEIVSWSDGTDEQVVAMVEAADAGLINLSDYWNVGDTRTVRLSAMAAEYVEESHEAQTVEFVLMNEGGKELATPLLSGRTTCSFVVGMKDCLNAIGYMNSSNTNVGGWSSCGRRPWCNNVFKNSIPSTLLPAFKQFQNMTSAGNESSTINTDVDWFALPAEVEVIGRDIFRSSAGEGSQFTWYKTVANRIKKWNGSDCGWWERSPNSYANDKFCYNSNNNKDESTFASMNRGISPFGVI